MKITVTEEFLWGLYSFIFEAKEIAGELSAHRLSYYTFVPSAKNPVFKKFRKDRGAKKFSKLIYYLKKKGYIKFKKLENRQALIITKEGVDKALRASFDKDKEKRKDEKWIMLIFDIPKNRQGDRTLLRSILQNLNYKLLQQSVWVTPYDVLDKTEKLLQFHSLDKYIKIFLVEKI